MVTLQEAIKMATLRQEAIQIFLEKNPPSDDWKKRVKELLPAMGVVGHIPLAFVRECNRDDGKFLFVVTADTLCTDDQCKEFGITPPDGSTSTWGDLVPKLVELALFKCLEDLMTKRGKPLLHVPENWYVMFSTGIQEKIPIGACI